MARHLSYNADLVNEVRDRVLKDLVEMLKESSASKEFGKERKQLVEKLANVVMPRLNEISSPGGEPLTIQISEVVAKKNDITSSTNKNSK